MPQISTIPKCRLASRTEFLLCFLEVAPPVGATEEVEQDGTTNDHSGTNAQNLLPVDFAGGGLRNGGRFAHLFVGSVEKGVDGLEIKRQRDHASIDLLQKSTQDKKPHETDVSLYFLEIGTGEAARSSQTFCTGCETCVGWLSTTYAHPSAPRSLKAAIDRFVAELDVWHG
jgi:hypothetical protein